MTKRVRVGNIEIDSRLVDFVRLEAAPGTGIEPAVFWEGFAALVRRLAPRNAALLARRDALQSQIDGWHRRHPGAHFDPASYRAFLREIGYLEPEGGAFSVGTADVDAEIAQIAGPQLVVPVTNARYALNAANARWGSLYDALYGTDVIEGPRGASAYDPERGARVIAFVRDFLDDHFVLREGSHRDARGFKVSAQGLTVALAHGESALEKPGALKGYQGSPQAPSLILLEHHGLHVELHIDRSHHIGRDDPAGVSDVVIESAVTTIQDFEDSVATVTAEEKVLGYRNWLGLMRGTLQARFEKDHRSVARELNPDRRYRTPAGSELVLPGRSLMLVRNVGHHMLSDAITLGGAPIPETFIDAAITSLIALHDLRGANARRNSRTGSVYIVKPKMHGPAEAAFARELFAEVEQLLSLPENTLKIGIMDEERRTSVNLAECIRAVKDRVVFINTGFLDRTGDEIHTSMQAAAVPRKADIKKAVWLDAYERRNVDVGLACGLKGHAQIGKGMWAMPDRMADMMRNEDRPSAGGSEHGLGALAHRRDPARHALSPSRMWLKSNADSRTGPGIARGGVEPTARRRTAMDPRGDRGGAQQQCAEHSRLCGAMDRLRCRLLQGAGLLRRRADGGPRDASDLEPTCRELVAAPRLRFGRRARRPAPHGGRGRCPECR